MRSPILFIAGHPACGKTHFGNWLQTRGYSHLDVEADGGLFNLYLQWDAELKSQGISSHLDHHIQNLFQTNKPTVITWGCTPYNLSVPQEMKKHSVDLWWFMGDETEIDKHFQQRLENTGFGNTTAFRTQMMNIRSSWNTIEQLFHPNIIQTLNANGHLSGAEILSEMENRLRK